MQKHQRARRFRGTVDPKRMDTSYLKRLVRDYEFLLAHLEDQVARYECFLSENDTTYYALERYVLERRERAVDECVKRFKPYVDELTDRLILESETIKR